MTLVVHVSSTRVKSACAQAGWCRRALNLNDFEFKFSLFLLNFRYYVHASILDTFLERLVKYARELVVGDPFDKNTKMGPVCNKQHFEKVKSYIELATKSGAKILCGETVE